jgi:hypothetical protein
MSSTADILPTHSKKQFKLLRPVWRGRNYLLSPALDFFMVGGAALIAMIIFYTAWPYTASGKRDYSVSDTVITTMFLLSFIVNYPHFMMSYQILYKNFVQKLRQFKDVRGMYWRYVNAGIVVPIVLCVVLGFAAFDVATNKNLLSSGICIMLMMFFVGWHYMKQAFGVFIILSALKSIYYTAWERKLLLINSYVAWIGTFLFMWGGFSTYSLSTAFQKSDVSLPLIFVRFAPWIIHSIYTVMIVWALICVAVIVRAALRQRKMPSVTAVIGYSSMYYLFVFTSMLPPVYSQIVPLFHSLQYFLFVFAYQNGKLSKELRELDDAQHVGISSDTSMHPNVRFFLFLAFALVLGKLSFYYIPAQLDAYLSNHFSGLFPTNYFIALAAVFINVHHYFVDNVIWRKENRDVGEYLLGVKSA